MDKAKRSKNFTQNDKMRLVELITASKAILSKATGGPNYSVILKSKETAWNKVFIDFNSGSSSNRSLAALKKAWDNLKRDARTQRASLRCQLFGTGGGPSQDTEDLVLLKVEAAIGLSCSGMPNSLDSDGPAVQDDQQASTSRSHEEVVQPTQESAETEEWTLDENPIFTLPESPVEPVPTVRPSVPRKSFKRRLCLSKTVKDSLFCDLQKVSDAKLEAERVAINVQAENLQLTKVQSILQCDLLTLQTAKVKLQLEMLNEERLSKAAQSDAQLRILDDDMKRRRIEAARSEVRWEIELDILRLERNAKEAIAKKLQSECP